MKQEFYNLQVNTNGQKLYELSDQIIRRIKINKFKFYFFINFNNEIC